MWIARAQSNMGDAEYQNVIDESITLKRLHDTNETPEVIATNPALLISDLDSMPVDVEYPIHVEEKIGIQVVSHEGEYYASFFIPGVNCSCMLDTAHPRHHLS